MVKFIISLFGDYWWFWLIVGGCVTGWVTAIATIVTFRIKYAEMRRKLMAEEPIVFQPHWTPPYIGAAKRIVQALANNHRMSGPKEEKQKPEKLPRGRHLRQKSAADQEPKNVYEIMREINERKL